MKKIKYISGFVLIFILVFGLFLLNKKENYSYYLVLGDYISNNQLLNDQNVESFSSYVASYLCDNKLVNESNTGYLKNNMTSKKMLEMIEKDTYKDDETALVSLIKKSKYITITLGINDIINLLKYDTYQNKLVYDKDIIVNKIEILKHNYHEIIEEIKNLNSDVKVFTIGVYQLYEDKELMGMMNSTIKEVSREQDAYYVDISNINDKYMYQDNELYLTNLGQEEISKKVISLIKQIEKV